VRKPLGRHSTGDGVNRPDQAGVAQRPEPVQGLALVGVLQGASGMHEVPERAVLRTLDDRVVVLAHDPRMRRRRRRGYTLGATRDTGGVSRNARWTGRQLT
jgi:hypothetical protein